jgi:hypothetical protein
MPADGSSFHSSPSEILSDPKVVEAQARERMRLGMHLSNPTPLEIHAKRLSDAAFRVSAWLSNNESQPPEDMALELVTAAARVRNLMNRADA